MDPIKKKKIEDQIESEQKTISYDMKEFTIELYVNKYLDKIVLRGYTDGRNKERDDLL